MHKLLIPIATLLLHACNSSDDDNGGACTYVTDTIGATIIRIDSAGPTYPEIVLTANNSNGELDTIWYSNNSGEAITWDQVHERGYVVGAKLKCVHQLRTSGHCTPEYFVVKPELFQ